MIAQMPDLVVTDKKRWPILAIEVQNHKEFDREYAINFRKEFVPELAIAGNVRNLMITSQDTAYLWITNDQAASGAPPSLEFDMRPVVDHYLTRFGKTELDERIRNDSLRLYLRFWIQEIIRPMPGAVQPPIPPEIKPLLDQAMGGEVQEEVVYP